MEQFPDNKTEEQLAGLIEKSALDILFGEALGELARGEVSVWEIIRDSTVFIFGIGFLFTMPIWLKWFI